MNFPCFQNWMVQQILMSQNKEGGENVLLQITNTTTKNYSERGVTSLWYLFIFPSLAPGIYLLTSSFAFKSLPYSLPETQK